MDSLHAIRIFARVVETGSFTKAADTLDIPLATASKLVHGLEAQLGIKLLQRTTRNVTVTVDGEAYYDSTVHLVRQLDEVNSSFGTNHARPMGKIRVDTSASLASSLLIPALPGFHERYPDIEIDLSVGDRTTSMMIENVDCAIRGGPLYDDTLVAKPVGGAAFMTCASPGYLERYGTPQSPLDIASHHRLVGFVSARTGRLVPATFGEGAALVEVVPNAFLTVNEGNAHLAAGLAGVGIIHSFEFKVRPYLASGQLLPILESWRPAAYPYHVVFPQNRHLSQRLRLFIDWLIETFGDLDRKPNRPVPRL
ncbi:LysR family transcriptional regulator [Rugamonas sp.]|uniref:LysR substrate-binding domain-containing protein n=1 Tax=Rugamonas sp. TaxID=1926287 RepID=UPI0025DA2FCC|nr:LysR family transcriptional regulator [Rugamonas sp.]